MSANLQNPIFQDETKAREWLERRVWPHGPNCVHCGAIGDDVTKLEGAKHRPGLYQCNQCREQFTVTVGTVFERSKIPLSKWLAALFLLTASKKGISAHQIHRSLGISYKSSWFMMHRLREAMRSGGLEPPGGGGKIVEADETYFGKADVMHVSKQRKGRPYTKRGHHMNNRAIVALVERGGRVRSFHPAVADGESVANIVRDNIAREAHLMTDESHLYTKVGWEFATHHTVKHSAGEYVRGKFHTNTVEGYFSVFKRGMRGVYQHCKEKHLHRYLAEYDFRYNNREGLGMNDLMRAELLASSIAGKRLTYRRPDQAQL
jgi:transposase-like protein